MDAINSQRWDSTQGASGEIDGTLGDVFDREWRRILTHAPGVRLQNITTFTSDSITGRFPISQLSTGSADTLARFYKLRALIIDQAAYQEVPFEKYSMGEIIGLNLRVYWREGDNIMTLPKVLSKVADAAWVTHIPQRPDALSADSVTITFPDGYDEIYILETAARLLAKGAAEYGGTQELKQVAQELRQEMLDDLARFSNNPLRQMYEDQPFDYGG